MSAETADNLVAIEIYRPLNMRQWFQVDPLANTVKEKKISGVRCEVAEAVVLPEGGQVVWRISGVSQCAENSRDLEAARINKVHQVNLGTLKVDPVKIATIPNRIITRTIIDVLPLPLLDIKRIDDEEPYKLRPGPKCSKIRQFKCPADTSKDKPRSGTNDYYEETSDSKEESEQKEVILRPPALTGDEADLSQDALDSDFDKVHVKEEPIDDDTSMANVNVQQEPIHNDNNAENLRTVSCRKPNRRLVDDKHRKAQKRRSRGDILRAEKKLKEDPVFAYDPTKQLRPLDSECRDLEGEASIYIENGDVYDVMLNQTNVEFNNNKYYLLQLAKANNRNQFYVWFRWGRVGKKGQNNLIPCGDNLEKAKKLFKEKFFAKTCNEFDERNDFVKVKGKYDLVQVCADETDSQTLKEELAKLAATQQDKKPCHLEPELKDFVELICNVKKMEAVLKELKFDAQRCPLGKLTKQQISAGYAALKVIEDCVSNNIRGMRLTQACNDFYTRIPHDFGMRVPPLIRSHEEIHQKIELLEALTDVQFAIELLRRKISSDSMHITDRHYLSLGAELKKVPPKELEFINNYLQVTHAPTHKEYTMHIQDAFAITKPEEIERFNSGLPNRMLLWHGSRLSNWASIISQGLRIAPPEAPVTGYMFGKGVYFADSSSKSANYCFPSRAQDEGVLLLSEVALGKVNELYEANYDADKLPKGKHSVKGMGRIVPSKDEFVKIHSPVDKKPIVVPCGKLGDISNQIVEKGRRDKGPFFTLNYNEYVVYNVNQIKMRYVLRVKFVFD